MSFIIQSRKRFKVKLINRGVLHTSPQVPRRRGREIIINAKGSLLELTSPKSIFTKKPQVLVSEKKEFVSRVAFFDLNYG